MKNKIKEFFKYISSFSYGWQDVNGNMHERIDKSYYDTFRLRDKKDVESSRSGVCWEIVEIERDFFENNNIPHKIVFVVNNDVGYHCHTFSIYELDGKYYWFEGVLKDFKGIYEFDSLDELLENVKDNFEYIRLSNEFDRNKIEFYTYDKVKSGISCQDFYDFCMKSEKL